MEKTKMVIYVDPQGREHEALVTALNGLNEGYISVVYVDKDAPENENLHRVYDIPHFSDEARKEVRTVKGVDNTGQTVEVTQGNAGLPDIHLNCWKDVGEAHTAPAADHPMFDHPFADKKRDEFGTVIEPERPGYAGQVAEHVAGLPSAADLDKEEEEEKAKEATRGKNGKPKPIAVGK